MSDCPAENFALSLHHQLVDYWLVERVFQHLGWITVTSAWDVSRGTYAWLLWWYGNVYRVDWRDTCRVTVPSDAALLYQALKHGLGGGDGISSSDARTPLFV